MNFVTNTPQLYPELDLEQLYTDQATAEDHYELALTYKTLGFREKAIIEFYKLCDMKSEVAQRYILQLAPLLFH